MTMSKIVVSGKVVRAPEKRFTPNTNVAVTEFAIAVESPIRQDGTVESQPVKVVAWRDLAERCAQEIKKGDLVAVDGRLQINNFTNSDGARRRDAEIEATAVENLTAVVANGGAQTASQSASQPERSFVKAGAKPAGKGQGGQQQEDLDAIFASEDEIPF
jgi:single-strand DNA-binding protein